MGLVLWGYWSEESMFFFKKKNQKIFGPAGCGDGIAWARRRKSLFGSFSSEKERLIVTF
jgi:hypothetical protein